MECIFCKSNRLIPIKKYPSLVVEHEFQLLGCVVCKSRFFEIEDGINFPELYDEQANRNSDLYQEHFQESRYWKKEVEMIRKVASRPPQRILDIGCRTGDFLLHWPSATQRVGVELSEVSSSIARKRGLTVVNASIEEFDFTQKFDVVTCFALVEHLRNPMAFVQKLGTFTEKGGILAMMIPTWECVKLSLIEFLGLRWHMYSPPLHTNFFSRRKLDQTLSECGFEIINRRYTSGGLFNPFAHIWFLNRVTARAIWEIESGTSINQLPIFDHMYSYYRKL